MKAVRFRQALVARQTHLTASHSTPLLSSRRWGRLAMSRRRFMQGSGALIAAATIAGVARPRVLQAAGNDPIPVPGSPAFDPFSIWAPIFVDSIDADPASITDFNGVAGIAYVSGMVRRTDTSTGDVDVLPFLDADMRFMQGVYRGVDGKPRRGTFGFI